MLIIVGIGYYLYQNYNQPVAVTTYTLDTVKRGSIIKSISGSGQISSSNQVSLQPKVSAQVTRVYVQDNQQVKEGQVLVQLDASDASRAVRDAKSNLVTAQLALEKLKQSADNLTLLQAQNAIITAQENKKKTESDLEKSYEEGFNQVASVFLDLPTLLNNVDHLLHDNSIVNSQQNIDWYANQTSYDVANERTRALQYKEDVKILYQQSLDKYNSNFSNYKATSRDSSQSALELLILQTYDTVKTVADLLKQTSSYIGYVRDAAQQRNISLPNIVATQLSSLNGYINTTNGHVSNLLNSKNTIISYQDQIVSNERSIQEKIESLKKIQLPADALDVRSAELTIQQRQNTLSDTQAKLGDYSVRAPFAGAIVALTVTKGDQVSSGTSLGTLITDQKVVEISLNEVDATQIKIGNMATLTFDAISDLSLTGKVSNVDALGTVSQGVVTYNAKIVLDTQDSRIKPGMSATAAIIIASKSDVLLVASSAIKTNNSDSYLEVPDEDTNSLASTNGGVILTKAPRQQIVEIGLTNDSQSEILSGAKEGDQIIVRMVSSGTSTSAPTNQNIFQATTSSGNRASSGGVRIPGGDFH
ncbi:MAG: hypothetical protein COX77_01535 [Candidatus Komeilibacteria bacterium CG_4_10_14_0_2_um_filter_37_10]|uniref:Uncharacterized protein n=1 Tax=Candidatus Komeilibacteria bacterium CG_4_10_14_0_2_um_filter_37_10 TaxID=1974470 RepID=A0A2M7VFQ4_9BACT|nr:MAG: hypothetical protein COX77_01535 [Candidatus Komeilibacteria bacterium CG_4_10_14_0_2_um_filter_37_10]